MNLALVAAASPSRSPAAPSGAAQQQKVCYSYGETFSINFKDKEGNYFKMLRLKALKIEVWWKERGLHYQNKYAFIGMTLTFKDYQSFLSFDREGGRRAFMKRYKRYCERMFGREVILDYVCVAEFQQRGMIHYHYLLVVPFGVKLPFPDAAGLFKWGWTNLKYLKARGARDYLKSYIKKLRQMDYRLYCSWKLKYLKPLRMYDFARNLGRGLLSMLNRGWGRLLYFRYLRFMDRWKFVGKEGVLLYGDWAIKALWETFRLRGRLIGKFFGFEARELVRKLDFVFRSYDDLEYFLMEGFLD